MNEMRQFLWERNKSEMRPTGKKTTGTCKMCKYSSYRPNFQENVFLVVNALLFYFYSVANPKVSLRERNLNVVFPEELVNGIPDFRSHPGDGKKFL